MVTMYKKPTNYQKRTAELLRLQIVVSFGLFVGLFLTLFHPAATPVFFGLLASFVISAFTNMIHLYAPQGARAVVPFLLFGNLAFIATLIAFAIYLLGGN